MVYSPVQDIGAVSDVWLDLANKTVLNMTGVISNLGGGTWF